MELPGIRVARAKAANLAVPMAAGLPVLPGFVLTTEAALHLQLSYISDPDDAAYRYWVQPSDTGARPLAVRSSVAEDSTTSSTAGWSDWLGVLATVHAIDQLRSPQPATGFGMLAAESGLPKTDRLVGRSARFNRLTAPPASASSPGPETCWVDAGPDDRHSRELTPEPTPRAKPMYVGFVSALGHTVCAGHRPRRALLVPPWLHTPDVEADRRVP
jgi:hypothetical protein